MSESHLADMEARAPTARENPPPLPAGVAELMDDTTQKDTAKTSTQNSSEFNPAIHATDKDGNPVKTGSGAFALKRGRKAGGQGSAPKGPGAGGSFVHIPGAKSTAGVSPNAEIQPVTDDAEYKAVAAQVAMLTVTVGVTLGGQEFQPVKAAGVDELTNLEQTWYMYFKAKGGKPDLPPGVLLAMGLASYITPRFLSGKETKSRIGRVRDWFGKLWTSNSKNAKQSVVDTRAVKENGKSEAPPIDMKTQKAPTNTKRPLLNNPDFAGA